MLLTFFLSLNHTFSSLAVQCCVLAEVVTGRFGNPVWLRYANLHLAGGNIRSLTRPRAQSFKSVAALAFQFQFRLAKIMEWRLAVDAAAVDNSNDSGRNWKLSMLCGIASLPRALGPRGWDKWEIWGTTASREGRWDCRYCPFHPRAPPLPTLARACRMTAAPAGLHEETHDAFFGLPKRNNNFLCIKIKRMITRCCVCIFSQPSFPSAVWASVKCGRIWQTRQTVCVLDYSSRNNFLVFPFVCVCNSKPVNFQKPSNPFLGLGFPLKYLGQAPVTLWVQWKLCRACSVFIWVYFIAPMLVSLVKSNQFTPHRDGMRRHTLSAPDDSNIIVSGGDARTWRGLHLFLV